MCSFSAEPKRWIKATAGTVFAQTAFHLVQKDAQHRPLQVGIVVQEVA